MAKSRALTKISIQEIIFIALIGAIVFFSTLPLLNAAAQSPSAKPYWNNFLDDAVNDQDLDVRDAQNHRIQSQPERATLRDLFTFKIFHMMVQEDLPQLAKIRRLLAETINPLSEKIQAAARCVWGACEAALGYAVRQLDLWVRAYRGPAPGASESRVPDDFQSQKTHQSSNQTLPLRC